MIIEEGHWSATGKSQGCQELVHDSNDWVDHRSSAIGEAQNALHGSKLACPTFPEVEAKIKPHLTSSNILVTLSEFMCNII